MVDDWERAVADWQAARQQDPAPQPESFPKPLARPPAIESGAPPVDYASLVPDGRFVVSSGSVAGPPSPTLDYYDRMQAMSGEGDPSTAPALADFANGYMGAPHVP